MRLTARFKQYLFRWHSDGTGPTCLGQRRIFIIPSRGGLLFAVALVVMLLGAINYNLALGYALVFLLAGLGISGMIHTFRNLFGLTITPGRGEPVFAGQTVYFPLLLDNDRNSPRLALELAADLQLPVAEASIEAQSATWVRIPIRADQRGRLVLPRVRLSTRYPLGLFTAWAYLQPDMQCWVYPHPVVAPMPAESPTHQGSMLHGQGGQEDFAGLRSRQPPDSLRHVAWKASARTDVDSPLLVKEFAGGAQGELIIDWQLTDPALADEVRIGVLTYWVLTAETAGNVYGLRLPNLQLPPASGELHSRQCLEALAVFQP